MDAEAEQTCGEKIAILAAGARKAWNSQHARRGERPWCADPFETILTEAIGIAASEGRAARAALQSIYGARVEGQADGTPSLDDVVIDGLIEIESRLGRAFANLKDETDTLACLCRQGTLVALMSRGPAQRARMASVVEAVLEARLDQELASGHGLLANAIADLAATPPDDFPFDLPLAPSPAELANTCALGRTIARSVAASPPQLMRFVTPEKDFSPAQLAALRAPRQASALLDWLDKEAPESLDGATDGPQPSTQCRSILNAALCDWLVRSVPMSRSDDLQRSFADWRKHVLRSWAVKAHLRWPADFGRDHAAAMKLGRAMARVADVNATSLRAYANLCLRSEALRLPPPTGEATGWYLRECEAIERRLPAEMAEMLMLRRLRSRGGEELLSFLRAGDIEQGSLGEAHYRQTLLAAKAQCATAPLHRWAVERTLADLDRGPRPPPPLTLPQGFSETALLDVIVNFKHRATWLSRLETAPGDVAVDALLDALQDSLAALFGRGDAAVSYAIARRLWRAGQEAAAQQRVVETLRLDHRARCQAIGYEMLGSLILAQKPGDAGAWREAYEHLLLSWEYTEAFDDMKPAAIGSLLRAAAVAIRAGWPAAALYCVGKIRRAQNKRGRPVAWDPWPAQRLRLQAIARWAAGRRQISGRLVEVLNRALIQATAQLSHRQKDRVDENANLVRDRELVAELAACLRWNQRLSSLVASSPEDRLHALGVACQRHGRRSIDDAVTDAALDRLDRGTEAITFVGAALARAYFEDRGFPQLLNRTIQSIKSRQRGAAAIEALSCQLPEIVASEIAAKCAEVVLNVDLSSRANAARHIESLLEGGLVRALKPAAYGGSGTQFLDHGMLQTVAHNLRCEAASGHWVESVFCTRALEGLSDHLRLASSPRRLSRAFSKDLRGDRKTLRLVTLHDTPTLICEGEFFARNELDEGQWRSSAKAWVDSFSRAVQSLCSTRREMALPRFEARHNGPSVTVRATIPLWRPAISPTATLATEFHAQFDKQYVLHLARLTGRLTTEVTRSPLAVLHSARTALVEPPPTSPANERIKAELPRRPHVPAIINAAAGDITRQVRLRYLPATSRLFEVLAPYAQKAGVPPLDFLRGVEVAVPEAELRLTLRTVFENALEASRRANGKIAVDGSVAEHEVTVTIDAPFLEATLRPRRGLGLGIASVTSFVEFFGGRLHQVHHGRVWRVTLVLPFLETYVETSLEANL